jgi:hypothetical protein
MSHGRSPREEAMSRERWTTPALLAIVLATAVAVAPAAAKETERFDWTGTLPAGGAVEIKNVNGSVEVEPGAGSEVVVEAIKSGGRDDPSTVRIEVVEHDGGITVCAVYPGKGNECVPGAGGGMNSRNNDVGVEFRVRVPANATVAARTVNGRVEVGQVEGDVDASTVNGSIEVDADGAVHARTVNGSIDVRIDSSAGDGDLEFETVNGSIDLRVPRDLAVDLDLRTQNGSIDTDWEVPVERTWSGRRLAASVAGGGRRLRARTVNGDIAIRY